MTGHVWGDRNCASIRARVLVDIEAWALRADLTHIGADNINSVPNAREIEFAAG